MADYSDTYIFATTHEFKTHISRYMRLLKSGKYKGVMVKRYNRVAGYFIVPGGLEKWEARIAAERYQEPEAKQDGEIEKRAD